MAQLNLCWAFLLLLGNLYTSWAGGVPHFNECRLCQKCYLTDVQPTGRRLASVNHESAFPSTVATTVDSRGPVSKAYAAAVSVEANIETFGGQTDKLATSSGIDGRRQLQQRGRRKAAPRYDPELDPTVPFQYKPSRYLPRPMTDTANLPVCSECYGCQHDLTLISASTTFLNNTYANEMGATSSWIFKSNTNMTPSGQAVVKVYCVPVAKRPGARIPTCNPIRIAEVMRHLMAIDKLSVECGFTDLVPRMWLAPVKGILPGIGYPIDWWGLWMEYVDGISMENFLYRGAPKRLSPPVIADFMNDRLNGTRVVRGAIFDLLTSQCDRHAQNVFMQEDGNIKLIDNESCLQHMWLNCGFDSVLVPTTQKQEIVRLANHYVLKLPSKTGEPVTLPRGIADPQLLLDYRCYLPDGQETMGTQYPPEIDTCLRRIAAMTPKQVKVHFDFPEVRVAANLHTRATDMVTRGYEWAAKYGAPQNTEPKRYRVQPKCCRIKVSRQSFGCDHPWEPSHELPLGNPITGREWDKDRPDPGTYRGGTFPEDAAGEGQGGAGEAAASGGDEQ